MFIYKLINFLTSTAFVPINAKYGIPLRDFEKKLSPDKYGKDENITLYAFHFVTYSVGNKEYAVNIDHVYLTANGN